MLNDGIFYIMKVAHVLCGALGERWLGLSCLVFNCKCIVSSKNMFIQKELYCYFWLKRIFVIFKQKIKHANNNGSLFVSMHFFVLVNKHACLKPKRTPRIFPSGISTINRSLQFCCSGK